MFRNDPRDLYTWGENGLKIKAEEEPPYPPQWSSWFYNLSWGWSWKGSGVCICSVREPAMHPNRQLLRARVEACISWRQWQRVKTGKALEGPWLQYFLNVNRSHLEPSVNIRAEKRRFHSSSGFADLNQIVIKDEGGGNNGWAAKPPLCAAEMRMIQAPVLLQFVLLKMLV